MSAHEDRLRELVEEAAAEASMRPDDVDASSDLSIRLHLQYLAEAMEATAHEPLRTALAGFADSLPESFDAAREGIADLMERAKGAIALEEHLQFGTTPGADPSLDIALERRTRVTAWIRVFLIEMEHHIGPQYDGLADQTLAWMTDHQRDLSRLVVTFDNRAKSSLPPDLDRDIRDQVGQVAVLRAHVRHTVEAIAACLPGAAEAV